MGSQSDLHKLQIFGKGDFDSEYILSREERNSRDCIWLFLVPLHPSQDLPLLDIFSMDLYIQIVLEY